MRPSFPAAALCAALLSLPATAADSIPRLLAPEKGAWFPLPPKLVSPKSAKYFGYQDAQIERMTANLLTYMEKIHRDVPFINPPKGYDVKYSAVICEAECFKGQPMKAQTTMVVLDYTVDRPGAKPERAPEGPTFKFWFNDIGRVSGKDDGVYFPSPRVISHIDGRPVYDGGLVVLSKIDKPLFVPVSFEKVIGDDIAGLTDRLDMVKKSASTQTTPGDIRYVRDMTAKLEKQLAEKRDKLAAMSPAERAAPYVDRDGTPYVYNNKDFLDRSRPSALQLVVIDLHKYSPRARTPMSGHAMAAVETIKQQLDLQKLRDALE